MRPLQITEILAVTARTLASGWKTLLRETAAPATVWVVASVFQPHWGRWSPNIAEDPASLFWHDGLGLLLHVSWVASLTVVSVACGRLAILGAESMPRRWGIWWSSSATGLLGRTTVFVLVGVCVVFLSLAFSVVLTSPSLTLPTLMVLTLVPYSYLALRLSLVIPASAIGQPIGWRDSWQLTRSSVGRLAVLLLPAIFPIGFFLGLFNGLPNLSVLGFGVAERGSIAVDASLALLALATWSGSILLLSGAFRCFVPDVSPGEQIVASA